MCLDVFFEDFLPTPYLGGMVVSWGGEGYVSRFIIFVG